jgi:glutathione S-transferase
MLGVNYERRFEDNHRKGPKRKSPWIEDGDVRMGDTEFILNFMQNKYGTILDAHLTAAERARAHVLRRMLEEHFHQVFEYELMTSEVGRMLAHELLKRAKVPAPLIGVLTRMIQSSFRKHLFERGIARHTPAQIEAMGRDDVDAMVELLGDAPWFVAERPTKTDASALGLLAVAIRSQIEGPVCSYARSIPSLVRYVDKGLAHFFPELGEGTGPSAAAVSANAAA